MRKTRSAAMRNTMMNKPILLIAAATLAVGGVGFALGANAMQEPQDASAMMPKPGPEHKIMNQDLGTWNAAVKVWMAPGQPPMEMLGTESNKWDCNGLWMMSSFDAPDGSFSGRGIGGWDSTKKQYVSVWVDSMSTYLATMTGTYDPKTKTVSYKGEAPDQDTGKMNKIRSTVEYVDVNTRRYTSWSTPAGGTEVKSLEINYTRSN